jgi:hypothetical protein
MISTHMEPIDVQPASTLCPYGYMWLCRGQVSFVTIIGLFCLYIRSLLTYTNLTSGYMWLFRGQRGGDSSAWAEGGEEGAGGGAVIDIHPNDPDVIDVKQMKGNNSVCVCVCVCVL